MRRRQLLGASSLRILFIGGTGFIGPHMVRAALARGHVPTLFNRGRTNPHLFPNVEKLVGDRDGGLAPLEGRQWDAVIDTSGYVPRVVRASAQLLAKAAKHYLFISTGDVYADFSIEHMEEDAPLIALPEPDSEDTGKYYGPLKVLCEREVREAFPTRHTILRPGWIVGPGDNLNLFTYWPVRIARGGEVLAPGAVTDPVQIIDARDMAEWIVRLLEAGTTGIYNAFGPGSVLSIAEFLYGIRAVTSEPTRFTWVSTEFLLERKIRPWRDIPIWYPPIGDHKGNGLISPKRAVAAGLTYRPLADTSRDTLRWFESLGRRWGEGEGRYPGITAGREQELLAEWHKANG
ncbi:MAG: NAD-dependent epimerase/dehydratase family protein [Gemmatimonadales bacterium]